jgi:hypothetical protein
VTDPNATASTSNLTPTHGVLLVLVTSFAVLGSLMAFGFRPKKSSK